MVHGSGFQIQPEACIYHLALLWRTPTDDISISFMHTSSSGMIEERASKQTPQSGRSDEIEFARYCMCA